MKHLDNVDEILIATQFNTKVENAAQKLMLNIKAPERLKKYYQKLNSKNIDIILTNTKFAIEPFLEQNGIEADVAEINRRGVEILDDELDNEILIAGNIGSSGLNITPYGIVTLDEAIEIYREQIEVIAEAGADMVYLNLFNDIQNLRAAILASNAIGLDLPIIATANFSNGQMESGTDISTFATVLNSLDIDALGINNLKLFRELEKNTNLPLLAELDKNSKIEKSLKRLKRRQLYFVSLTTDTTLDDIEAVSELKEKEPERPNNDLPFRITSNMNSVDFGPELPFVKIGERINPTNREKFAEELKQGDISQVIKDAETQIQVGADLLDINLGASMVDEKEVMRKAIIELQQKFEIPLVIDSSNPSVLETGLKNYAGKALINSVDADPKKQDQVLPLVEKYGAGVIVLTIKDGRAGPPERRLDIARSIIDKCEEYNIAKHDIIIDTAALSAATSPEAGPHAFETIKMIKEELDLPTVMGISNTSFGLPKRNWIHNTFLAQAMAFGLDAGIVNVEDPELEKVIMSASVFAKRDEHCMKFIKYVRSLEEGK